MTFLEGSKTGATTATTATGVDSSSSCVYAGGMRVLGIDPGTKGALALLDHGNVIGVWDMPTVEIRVGKKKRNRIIAAALAAIVRDARADHAFVENVHSTPNDGHAGAFVFGKACGYAEMACAALGVPFTLITPAEWKGGLRVPADKDGARARASQLLPGAADRWPLVKHDGRAEACLLALYGSRRDGLAPRTIEW